MTGHSPKPVSPFSDEIWLEIFEAAFLDNPDVAVKAARLCHYLLIQIESGPQGITNAKQCLENGIRLVFPFTASYKACRDQFEASLADRF